MELIGVDIDLRRCHTFSNERGRGLYNAPLQTLLNTMRANRSARFLVECASPHIYGLKKAAMYNKLRWLVWNSYAIGSIHRHSQQFEIDVLIAPSSIWKHGLPEKPMMELLNIRGDNHDIRQCRAMIIMYEKHVDNWVPIDSFMDSL